VLAGSFQSPNDKMKFASFGSIAIEAVGEIDTISAVSADHDGDLIAQPWSTVRQGRSPIILAFGTDPGGIGDEIKGAQPCCVVVDIGDHDKFVAASFGDKSRPQESEQDDKWSFCLTAGTLCPANQER
jgi:hypothetical protein